MIEKQSGAYTPVCDCCGAELSGRQTFQEVMDDIKAAGWRMIPPEGVHPDWELYCSACTAGWYR